LTELKALLEDDVKNLEKREKEGHGIGGGRKSRTSTAAAAAVVKDEEDGYSGATGSAYKGRGPTSPLSSVANVDLTGINLFLRVVYAELYK
jgi:hypothetical protein